jgi:serine/threonine-protein kinase RIM15
MRTNSRGSVISVEDIGVPDSALPSSPPPMITEDTAAEEYEGRLSAAVEIPPVSLTPPVIFPESDAGDGVANFLMDADAATPKAQKDEAPITPDPDPTPRAGSATGA